MADAYTLHMNGQDWQLVTKSRLSLESDASTSADIYRRVHIVRMHDLDGQEITNARVWGTWEEVDKAARSWQNGLCRANPGQFVRHTIEQAKEQY